VTDPQGFMKRAIALAVRNVRSGRGGPFAALVVKDGRIIGRGANRVVSQNDPTAHAEILAMREACKTLRSFQLTGCEIYSTCEPCPMCLGAIYWARPSRVYFGGSAKAAAAAGFDDAFIYGEAALPPSKRKIPMVPMMREEALAAFRAWKSSPNRKRY